MKSPVAVYPASSATRRLLALVVLLTAVLLIVPARWANAAPEGGWIGVAQDIGEQLDAANTSYDSGDYDLAKQQVKDARYVTFVGSGFETALSAKSGSDADDAIMDFALLTQAINNRDGAEVDAKITELKTLLAAAGEMLDGASVSAEDLAISPGKWGTVASNMVTLLEEAKTSYGQGDVEGAKDKVNDAYYGHYELTGFEKVTMSRVSGGRVATVELQFALIKKAMADGQSTEVTRLIDEVKVMLIQDANTLDGFDPATGETSGGGALTIFIAALGVILREGLEAILVLSAVIAFLVKSGHQDKTRVVWLGTVAALVLSVLMAIALSMITSLAGKNRELIEGITALIAVAMLIWVSNWMINNSSNEAWDKYLKDKTSESLSRGSLFSLAFVAFLAVLREGAETILFYQPILAMADSQLPVWLGLGVGAVILVVVYAGIRFFSLRIPLRPFFLATSILLAILAFTFTGAGIKELQEADVLSSTPLDGWPTIDLLGIYPRVENLAAQAMVLVIVLALFKVGSARQRRQAAAAENTNDTTE